MEELVRLVWSGVADVGVKSGHELNLHLQSADRKGIQLVAHRRFAEDTPEIWEAPASYNLANFSFWIDTMEFLLSVDTLDAIPSLGITFMGNAVVMPGARKVVQIMLAVLTALQGECALLSSSGAEELETQQRLRAGESLLQILAGRLAHAHETERPLLAVLREDLYDPSTMQTGERPPKVRQILGGYVLISILQDVFWN
jgi:hypothetical protein